jgi:flagellar biosynthesis/type III secretory pathway protein FliH
MADARTIQALIDQEEARRKATPVLSAAQLDAAIAATQPRTADPAAPIREAIQSAVAAGRAVGYQQGRTVGQREGAEAGIAAANAFNRTVGNKR